MKPTNSLTQKKPTFSMVINSTSVQNMIMNSLKDTRKAASFTSTLISVVSSNSKLAECKPESVISAALRGEAMDLQLALGHYSIVPYGDSANYQISYKGLAKLATNTGLYKILKIQDVREGEYLGEDPDTWEPVIKRITKDREKLPLAGIRAMYELQNGFRNVIYWDHEKILEHADRYSQAFSKEKYEQLLAGKLSAEEVRKLQQNPWYGNPLSEPHLKMCRKTVLKQLLNDGIAPLSIEMLIADKQDTLQEKGDEIIYADDSRIVNTATGEIVDVEAVEKEQPASKKEAPKKAQSEAQMNFADMEG